MSSDFVAGYISGAAGILIGNPLDLIKVRLQARGVSNPLSITAENHGYFEGGLSLVKGAAAPIIGYGALNALVFVAYNRCLKLLNPSIDDPTNLDISVPLLNVWIAGAAGGLASWIVSSPTELVKCRTQLSTGRHVSSWSVFRDIFRNHGVKGLYYGGLITSVRDSVGYGFYFWSYELCKRSVFFGDSSQQKAIGILLCGGVAGIVTWASVFPLDVVKTRLQTQSTIAGTTCRFTDFQQRPLLSDSLPRLPVLNSIEIAREAYRAEGICVFFRGLGVCSARAFIVNAFQWGIYEWLMKEFTRAATPTTSPTI